MSSTRVSIGWLTVVVRREYVHVAVTGSQLAPASRKPSLHKLGLRADHLTIPLEPRASGRRAGTYWVHLTYPDGTHKEVAAVHPEMLKAAGATIIAAMREIALRGLVANAREIDAAWLAAQGYKLAFMMDDKFLAWSNDYFKQRSRHYRFSEERLKKSMGAICVEEPAILDDEEFAANPPRPIQAFSLSGDKETLCVWRFPWKHDGAFGWYAVPSNPLMSPELVGGAILRHLDPGIWDSFRTILVELGIPADYDHFDQAVAALKAGQLDALRGLYRAPPGA